MTQVWSVVIEALKALGSQGSSSLANASGGVCLERAVALLALGLGEGARADEMYESRMRPVVMEEKNRRSCSRARRRSSSGEWS